MGNGIVVAPLSPVLADAGVDLRLLALWYGEFVLLRFQDYRNEYPSATAPATLATSRQCRVETLGSARATTRMPGQVSSGRRLLASRHLRATILQSFPTYENIAKIPVQGVAAMADLMTSDSRVGPALGVTWLPTVSHQAVYDVLRALTDAGRLRRIQPSGSVGGGTLERYNGANFKI